MSDTEKLRLGGMALRNGLLVHGPTHWAAAIRSKDGKIKVASGRKPQLGGRAFDRVPGVRGVSKLAEAFAIIPAVKRRLPEAGLPMEDVKAIGGMVAAAAVSQAIRRGGERTLAREAAVSVLGLAPALLVLRGGDIAAYHGVEHKAIGAYEQGGDAAGATKEHDRCGSNLVAPLIATSALGNVAARRAGMRGSAADAVGALGGMAVAAEIFAWSERHSETKLAKALKRPGYEIQRLVGTREPTSEQLDVGRAALDEILRVEA
ncbi:MAG TPA: DUF1385 domain-containing protein [Thermoleophilaceae bacterium]